MSVVSVPSVPAGHPVLLRGQGLPWRWVALLLPDPHCVVLRHDPVIVSPFKEVTLKLGGKEDSYQQLVLEPLGRCTQPLPHQLRGPQSQDP